MNATLNIRLAILRFYLKFFVFVIKYKQVKENGKFINHLNKLKVCEGLLQQMSLRESFEYFLVKEKDND